jgi:hypothetical protein
MERVETKISRDLMEVVRAQAKREGRNPEEVVEDAVRNYLSRAGKNPARGFPEIFDSIDRYQKEHGVEPLSEEEAMKLAVEEQHAWRRERREQREREEGRRSKP